MGLPCAHIGDIRRGIGISLTSIDFRKHWYWERQSTFQLLLDLVQISRQRVARNPLVYRSTGRILSTGEEQPVRQPPTYSACREKGYAMSSRNCLLKLAGSSVTLATFATSNPVITVPASSVTFATSNPVITAPTSSPVIPPFTLPLVGSPISLLGSQESLVPIELRSPSPSPDLFTAIEQAYRCQSSYLQTGQKYLLRRI
jgi:hypothetical protein